MLPRAVQLQDNGITFRLVDLVILELASTVAGAAGTMQATADVVEQGYLWLVERIVIGTTSTTDTACAVYVGPQQTDIYRRDITDTGNDDVAEYGPPLLVSPGLALTLLWTGASLGAQGFASVQYQLVQKVSG